MGGATTADLDASSLPIQFVSGRPGAQSPAFELPVYGQDAWDQIMAQLRAMRGLPDDWDGLGAQAPLGEIVDSAVEWARYLRTQGQAPPSSVMAGPNGTIVFNWQDESGYLDAEITKPHYVEWMRMVPGRPTCHGAFEYGTSLGGR